MVKNKLNKNENTSGNRLNRDRDNVFGRNEWFNGLDFLQKVLHGVGSSLPCPALQLCCGFNNGGWPVMSLFFPLH